MNPAAKAMAATLLMVGLLVGLLYLPSTPPERTSGGGKQKAPLVVFCAAGLKPPVEAIIHAYEKEFGTPVQIQYGGSGTLLGNLRVAKTGDLFIAADMSFIEMAREHDLVAETIPVASMRPVIAFAKGNPKKISGIKDLLREDVSVALANPEAAAIGTITKLLLTASGDWAELEAKVKVFKPTVNDVANDVKLGTVDAAILWDATARQYPDLAALEVDALRAGEQKVALSVLRSAKDPTSALHLARYVAARDKGMLEFEKTGYGKVPGDKWAPVPEVVLYSGGVNRLAIEETITAFEAREGARVTRVYNGCGILVAQVKAGQRPDAYFACDTSFMTQLSDLFQRPVDVSETDMVILTAKGNPLKIAGARDLARPGLRVGLANAQQSALGALAARLFEKHGILEAVMANVVAQTPTADLLVNQIRTGSLDAVVVYEANTSQVKETLETLPLGLGDTSARQPYAVGLNSDHAELMNRLLLALTSAESKRRFEKMGFRWMAGGAAK